MHPYSTLTPDLIVSSIEAVGHVPDGRVLVTARNSDPRSRRVAAYSRDGASGWSNPEFIPDLLEPGCMAGLVRHPGTASRPKPFLLFSNPDTTKPAWGETERNFNELSTQVVLIWETPNPAAYQWRWQIASQPSLALMRPSCTMRTK